MVIEKKTTMQLVCFSHLAWKFVYQRPQHLLSRFTKKYDVYYIEEFIYSTEEDGYSINITNENVTVIVPHLCNSIQEVRNETKRKEIILKNLFKEHSIQSYIFWYYTPMALAYTVNFNPLATVYDCMDELSAFKFAPPELKKYEQELFKKANVVFTGGNNLYKAKKAQHHNIHSFPSSIDKAHFKAARDNKKEVADQSAIPHPRLGFYGVIDERFDIDLIKQAADAKPEWHFVLVGPVIKIDAATLPQNKNIHYLGAKTYEELPSYLSGWDIAMIPFAINESTRYISPTKTPEYLAGGKPVISTAITDVINPYHELGLVHIVQNAEDLLQMATSELSITDKSEWLCKVDEYLSTISWDATWGRMDELMQNEIEANPNLLTDKINQYV
ncbi:glycosyltransferase [Haliscomenobacter hydrossis]|uniref:UDP-galactopyranose mutase n=1 Tax=Haliscomenobacter hydrossis (strain ATCC 27775 / DSM 1100 / LMG 10767 / O) TaxID=760192 RepID=F4KUS0_HALH1|nr:glycosyltransferase [Haliscomenobacter hydrossis]AEE53473.1 UDP-galactopyranose mutase [Haliscomenobacter hydrossis DSM 1100]